MPQGQRLKWMSGLWFRSPGSHRVPSAGGRHHVPRLPRPAGPLATVLVSYDPGGFPQKPLLTLPSPVCPTRKGGGHRCAPTTPVLLLETRHNFVVAQRPHAIPLGVTLGPRGTRTAPPWPTLRRVPVCLDGGLAARSDDDPRAPVYLGGRLATPE